MSGYGDFYENKVTREFCVVLRGEEAPDDPGYVHLNVKPGGAVLGEHVHPDITERFIVLGGRLGTRVDGVERELGEGEEATAPAGVPHDWWNAGEGDASVIVELSPQTERFEMLVGTLFGLANDGRTNAKGMPSPPQLALIAREFDDTIRFTRPPRFVQKAAFAVLGAIGRMRGLSPTYPQYLRPHGKTTPDPRAVEAAGLEVPA